MTRDIVTASLQSGASGIFFASQRARHDLLLNDEFQEFGARYDLPVLQAANTHGRSFGERKMLDTARNLLVKELAIARAHPEEKIMEELRTIFAP